KGAHASASIERMIETGLLDCLLPEVGEWLEKDPGTSALAAPVVEKPASTEPAVPAPTPAAEVAPPPPPAPAVEKHADATPHHPVPLHHGPVPPPALPLVSGSAAPGVLPAPAVEIKLGPIDRWEPPRETIEAYLRVTWERPPKQGA